MANSKTGSGTKSWDYEEYKDNQATIDADNNRKNIEVQKPGKFTFNPYEKSDVAKQAETTLQQHLAQKPGEYQYAWQTQLDDTLNKILNREKFSYDLNGDALYQQYKDQYMRQGQQAMTDTMGQAQAMTGGYGNSYAQQVGQQAYNGYLQQLNDKVPELYQLALDQYNREGQDLYNQYGLLADRDEQGYGRYRDTVSDYYTDRDYYTDDARYLGEQDYGMYMDSYNMAYGQYRDDVGDWKDSLNRADSEYWNQYNRGYGEYSDNRNLSYQQYRDDVSDDQWQKNFDEGVRQFNVGQDNWQKNFDEGVRQFKKNDLISSITATGYEPTADELEAAGMSEEQAKSYSNAYKASQASGYKSLAVGSDAYNGILADIDAVESADDLANLAKRYIKLGYDPEQIDAMTSAKAASLKKKEEKLTPPFTGVFKDVFRPY